VCESGTVPVDIAGRRADVPVELRSDEDRFAPEFDSNDLTTIQADTVI
jgi:hypothetical protein